MNFLNELETHLSSFESKAKADIALFIAFVKSKYSEPTAAVVPPPAPIAPNGELTIGQEVPAVAEVTPVEAEVAPEVEEPAPVEAVEEAPAETEEPAKAE